MHWDAWDSRLKSLVRQVECGRSCARQQVMGLVCPGQTGGTTRNANRENWSMCKSDPTKPSYTQHGSQFDRLVLAQRHAVCLAAASGIATCRQAFQ